MLSTDTIVALSTPPGESAIAVIRLSGPACTKIASDILKKEVRPRYAHYAQYLDLQGRLIDDCVFTYFSYGKSFTGESMLEIAPHGNPLIVQKIVEDLLARGCRPAQPGEFTQTAFINGKMDLSQAEAVSDLIRARSDRSIEAAQRQLHGSVGQKMSQLTERLIGVIAHLEAYIDFPEEDLPTEDQAGPASELRKLVTDIEELIETQHYNALLHEGIKTLIVGEPNVGKSSLINALVGTDRSIVSNVAGTTRDYVSAFMMLGPWRIEILDTAGLRNSSDDIEMMGVHHTIEQAETADFFLLMLDVSSQEHPTLPEALISRMHPENTLIVENKIDLDQKADFSGFLDGFKRCRVSLVEGRGLRELRDAWRKSIDTGMPQPNADGVVVNARHAKALSEATEALELALDKMKSAEHAELVAADLRDAVDSIGKVVGKVDNERMLDSLFRQFCIGK